MFSLQNVEWQKISREKVRNSNLSCRPPKTCSSPKYLFNTIVLTRGVLYFKDCIQIQIPMHRKSLVIYYDFSGKYVVTLEQSNWAESFERTVNWETQWNSFVWQFSWGHKA